MNMQYNEVEVIPCRECGRKIRRFKDSPNQNDLCMNCYNKMVALQNLVNIIRHDWIKVKEHLKIPEDIGITIMSKGNDNMFLNRTILLGIKDGYVRNNLVLGAILALDDSKLDANTVECEIFGQSTSKE